MRRRVAIVGYAQSHHQHNMQKTREDMVFEVCREALHHADILREDLDTVVTASTDFLDGRTISSVFLSMAVGAFMKDESKVEKQSVLSGTAVCTTISSLWWTSPREAVRP
jgi:3-oxoacyl-[acyl-carrier-protein] synthase III